MRRGEMVLICYEMDGTVKHLSLFKLMSVNHERDSEKWKNEKSREDGSVNSEVTAAVTFSFFQER